jgi:hemerythrin superfamily protein
MDIFEIIRNDHTDIRRLLNEVIHQTSIPMPKEKRLLQPEDWEDALHDFKLSLVGHNRAEEALLYVLLRSHDHADHVAAESKTHEHRIAENLLADLENMNPRDRDWGTQLGLMKNQIESHQAEEETATFELLAPLIDESNSDRLAREFLHLRDDIVSGAKFHPKGRSVVNPAGLDLDR